MASIGLTNIWWAKLTEGAEGTPTYDGAKSLGKAVSCSESITNNDAKLYGDDALAESDSSFASGTMTLGVTDDDDSIFAPLLGHTLSDGEVTKTSSDTAPYVGVGRIVTKMVNGVYKYKAKFRYKVKFAEPSSDENTKGESIEFGTPSVEGAIASLADTDGTWGTEKTFSSKAQALSFLDGLMAAAGTTYRVTYDLMGGTGTVADVSVAAGSSLTVDSGSGITPPTDTTFAGWSLSSASTKLVGETIYPTEDITLYAVYTSEE